MNKGEKEDRKWGENGPWPHLVARRLADAVGLALVLCHLVMDQVHYVRSNRRPGETDTLENKSLVS